MTPSELLIISIFETLLLIGLIYLVAKITEGKNDWKNNFIKNHYRSIVFIRNRDDWFIFEIEKEEVT